MNPSDSVELNILSLNISEKKGTIKVPVPEINLNEAGIQSDAHAGNWQRQVSLLGTESIARFSKEAGREIMPGEFAENITTHGLELVNTKPLDRFIAGDIELEVTQIGKACHGDSCNIFREVGNCVMPKEGIFSRVIKGGKLQVNDKLTYIPKVYKACVITLSDRASRGDYEDKSGPAVAEKLSSFCQMQPWPVEITTVVIPDDADHLASQVNTCCHTGKGQVADFIFTTGGTGIGPRDITPDVIRPMLDKEIPGLMDFIRLKYGSEKPNALLSRSVAGVKGQTLIFALPGSVKAVNEYMDEILKSLKHMVYMLHNLDSHG
jgi:molybdopterin adenylyltransferase